MTRPPGRRRGPRRSSPPPRDITLTIDELGHRGDGIARGERGSIFVAGALPGETVRASVTGERAAVVEIVTPSPRRVAPFCTHFSSCGGCTSQHMDTDGYTAWKRGIVQTALANRGIEPNVDALVDAHGTGRRRATFHARKTADRWIVGFSAQRSHRIVDLDACPILSPELSEAPQIVRALAEALEDAKQFDAHIAQTDAGLDVNLTGEEPLDLNGRTKLAEAAQRLDLARISVGGEVVSARRAPRVRMGGFSVTPPPAAFLQATSAGEQILADLVIAHLGGAQRVADLFAGLGPFALRLAETAAVEAFDSDEAAIAALRRAANEAKLHAIKASARDLFVRPLHTSELDRFDGAVFDPPRAGAEAQARMLAASAVPTVCAVSCDPASFARDAVTLIAGGYRLARTTPIDQFKWSPHVEIVALFCRD